MRFSSFLDFLLPVSQLAIYASDPLQPLTISAPGINATFIGYGATLTHLFVNDRDGQPRDVAVGYDTPAEYVRDTETKHTYFGAVVGYVRGLCIFGCSLRVQTLMSESVDTRIGSRMGRLKSTGRSIRCRPMSTAARTRFTEETSAGMR
jgi:hypothetical protein